MHARPIALAACTLAPIAGAIALAQPGRTEPETPRQPPGETRALIPPLERRVGDRQAVLELVNDLYEAVSGPAGKRDWDDFRDLFAEGAMLVAIDRQAEPDEIRRMTVEEYIDRAGPILRDRGFFETDAGTDVQVYGRIAHAWSNFETREELDRAPIARGVNSIQCIKAPGDASWKILTVVWDTEADAPRPPRRRPRPQDLRGG